MAEGYRENGKVKHRHLLSFGKLEEIDQEQLKDIAIKLLGLCGEHSLIDIDATDEISRKNWGIPKIINALWSKFNLDSFFKKLLANRKVKYNIVNAIKLMLADRLSEPCSKYKTYQNKEYYEGLPGEELHNIYRSLNELCACKKDIEKHLFLHNKEQNYINLNVVFFDVTTFHFESVKQDSIRNFGYSKDCKFNEVQVVLSLLVTKDGIPVGFDLFPGNTYEGHTLTDAITKLKDQYDIKKIVVVADKGLNAGANLYELVTNNFDYIVGSRIKNFSKEMKTSVLSSDGYIVAQENEQGEPTFKYKIVNYDKHVKVNGKSKTLSSKLVCTWSKKRANKDLIDRERLVNKAKRIIKEGDASEGRGAKKYLTKQKNQNKTYTLNESKIAEHSKWDGFYAIETSTSDLSVDEILSAYKQLWKIEESFKIFKSHLETRPLYHWNPERIQGHFVLSYIAFLFERVLEIELHKSGTTIGSPLKIRESLSKMEFSEIQFGQNIHKLYSNLDLLGENLLSLFNIPLAKQLKKKAA